MVKEDEINIELGQVKEALTRGLAAADPVRAEGLAILLRLTRARDAGLAREQQRLAGLLAAHDPRLTAIAARLQASRDLGERVAFEARRADAGVVKPDPKAWTLQGIVLADDASFLKDKTVALFDSSAAIIPETETDLDDDKFVLRYAPKADVSPRLAPDVFVGLVSARDRRKRPAFLDPRPLKPQNGLVTYVEINVGVPAKDQSSPAPTPAPPSPERPRPQDAAPPQPASDASPDSMPGTDATRRATSRRRPAEDESQR